MRSEPAIISASRRTDIPAFHARWFMNRIRAGFCHWIHPYTAQVRRVSLQPPNVVAIVFWTRNPVPLMPHFRGLVEAGYPLIVQFTITGLGPPVESHNPPLARSLSAFETLAAELGPLAVHWRYDPIVLSPSLPPARHVERFARLAERLEGATHRCTFSFVDFYGKTTRKLARVESETGEAFSRPEAEEKSRLARELGEIAAHRGMEFLSCCDDSLIGGPVGKSRCVDPAAVAAVRSGPLPDLPARPTRRDCGCVRSVDIGAYDTCAFGCEYCYAVSSRRAALARVAAADLEDSLLWRPPSLESVDLASREIAT